MAAANPCIQIYVLSWPDALRECQETQDFRGFLHHGRALRRQRARKACRSASLTRTARPM